MIANSPSPTHINSASSHKFQYSQEKSKLITPEKPLLIPPLVAAEIGLEAAIILQQIHWLSNNSNNGLLLKQESVKYPRPRKPASSAGVAGVFARTTTNRSYCNE
ncbi:MAG: hypothetical protein KME30_28815 [Iphinoe sp. HA4291-MV1]|jgi:hypothetical protein|nr:hypothetical protein [Iphinoe sp. HA4291-MV1]